MMTSEVIQTKDLEQMGLSKKEYYQFLKENRYEKVSNGIYIHPEAFEDRNYILSLRYPQAVFSHEEALYYYDWIERVPIRPTLTMYTGFGVGRLNKEGVKVFTVKKEFLNEGKVMGKTFFGNPIPIYDRDRTICDVIRSKNWFEIQNYQYAILSYVKDDNKDLYQLMKYASMFHVKEKVRQTLELLL